MAVSTAKAEVLIVEDEIVYAFDVQSMLEERDISSSICYTGEDALRRMAEEPAISLVLMDLDLGDGPNGIETARRILKDYDVPLLFLSAHTDSELTDPLSTIDHYGFVPKIAGEFGIIQAVTAALRLDRSRKGVLLSARKYRDLVESLSDAVIAIDAEYTVQTANGSVASLIGGAKDALGQKCYRCFHGLESPCPWCPAPDVFASGSPVRTVVPYPSSEGGSRWFYLDASPVAGADGSVEAVVLSGRDVSEEEEGRRRELSSQQMFEELFRFAPQPYQSLDPAGRFLDVNDEWCRVLGYSREETVGRHFSEFLAPGSVDLFARRFPAFLESGRVKGVEFTLVKADGTTVETRFSGRIAYDHDRTPLRTHCIFQDVTDLVAAEHALAERHRQVSGLLEDRELLLKEVHHRIKNDMLLVRSLLSLQAGRTSSPETAAELSEAASRITLMGRIYERLYRSDNYESIQIRPTLLSIVSDLLSGASQGQIDLETEIEERQLPRRISVPIGIIVNELVNNSLKYAFAGGRKPHLRVALRVDEGMVEIEVEDNGPGMPPALRLPDGSINPGGFDSFGYTMIGALVAQHFGTATVEDAKGGGTLARVRLTIPESARATP